MAMGTKPCKARVSSLLSLNFAVWLCRVGSSCCKSVVVEMACVGRTMGRSFLSTTRSALRACKTSGSEAVGGSMKGRSPCAPSSAPSPSPNSFFQTRRPASYIFRLPGEVAAMQSLLPLHSATASSRLVAQLSTTAGALFQDDEDDT